VMKTKSVVRPSEIQRTVLDLKRLFDLERLGLGGSCVEVAIIPLSDDRRDESKPALYQQVARFGSASTCPHAGLYDPGTAILLFQWLIPLLSSEASARHGEA
jgi:hypothetical protein